MTIRTCAGQISSWLAAAMLAAGYCTDARADWAIAGAKYSCNSKTHVFELLPYDRSSDDPPEGIPLNSGFKEIPQGAPAFVCPLGTISLHVVVDVYPPASGRGMGAGFVRARSISISGVELLPDSPAFDWSIDPQTPPLTRIRVTAMKNGSVNVDRCYTRDTSNERCDSKDVALASLVKAEADTMRPASVAEQNAHSASKLPPEFDYAHAFVSYDRTDIPVCAHLSSSFLRGFSFNTPTEPVMIARQGRIAGIPGQRIHIMPANPQVCDAAVEPKCRGKAYLVPGDHVGVGFICGAWSYVQYVPQTRAAYRVFGWVSTESLYDVDSSISTNPHPSVPQKNAPAMTLDQLAGLNRIDANEQAAEASGIWQPLRDLPALAQRAIEAGASVNERDNNRKTALVQAIEVNNVDVAQVLLKAGADPNLDMDGQSILMIAMGNYANQHDPTMVKQLLEAGAAPNFRASGNYNKPDDDGPPGGCCGSSGQTALTMAAESGEFVLAQVLLSHGADPSIPRSDGALPADIARMEHHPLVAELIEKYAKSSGSKH